MVLFFIASSLFHDVEDVEKKIFSTEVVDVPGTKADKIEEESKSRFKLLDKAY